MLHQLNKIIVTFAILCIPREYFVIKPSTYKSFSIVWKLNVSHCFRMAYITLSAATITSNVIEMDLSFRSSQKEEMSNFWEKSSNLNTLFSASYPRKDLFFRYIAIISTSTILNWRLNVTQTFVILIFSPME